MNPTSKERSPGVDLAALREALAKATQVERGPFDTYSFTERRRTGDACGYRDVTVWAIRGETGRHVSYGDFEEVARAHVLLRNTAPALIAELEAAREFKRRVDEALSAALGAATEHLDLIDATWHYRVPRQLIENLRALRPTDAAGSAGAEP